MANSTTDTSDTQDGVILPEKQDDSPPSESPENENEEGERIEEEDSDNSTSQLEQIVDEISRECVEESKNEDSPDDTQDDDSEERSTPSPIMPEEMMPENLKIPKIENCSSENSYGSGGEASSLKSQDFPNSPGAYLPPYTKELVESMEESMSLAYALNPLMHDTYRQFEDLIMYMKMQICRVKDGSISEEQRENETLVKQRLLRFQNNGPNRPISDHQFAKPATPPKLPKKPTQLESPQTMIVKLLTGKKKASDYTKNIVKGAQPKNQQQTVPQAGTSSGNTGENRSDTDKKRTRIMDNSQSRGNQRAEESQKPEEAATPSKRMRQERSFKIISDQNSNQHPLKRTQEQEYTSLLTLCHVIYRALPHIQATLRREDMDYTNHPNHYERTLSRNILRNIQDALSNFDMLRRRIGIPEAVHIRAHKKDSIKELLQIVLTLFRCVEGKEVEREETPEESSSDLFSSVILQELYHYRGLYSETVKRLEKLEKRLEVINKKPSATASSSGSSGTDNEQENQVKVKQENP